MSPRGSGADFRRECALPLARAALELGAVKLSPRKPFKWAAGRFMPVYNDNRLLLGKPAARRLVTEAFCRILERRGFRPDNIAGTATAGIPHAALLAERLGLPLSYARAGGAKDHGLERRVEGVDGGYGGARVLLVEDLISTGKSSSEALRAVREAGGECVFIAAIFTYGLEAARVTFGALNPPCEAEAVFDWDTLVGAARDGGFIGEADAALLAEWREAPLEWGARHGFPPEAQS